jgi:2,4-dienoyl-CoA reductase-like NADH-dependent reductase (Old Yellow Enzyme family)/thioredoxin reductase
MKNILFEPFKINNMELKNRIVMAPMGTNFAERWDGYVTEQMINYYVERAKGGAGLIVVEASYVTPEGKSRDRMLGIHSDKLIPGLKALAEAIHEHTKVAIQLSHAGAQTLPEIIGTQPVAPSSIPYIIKGQTVIPKELSVEEIQAIIKKFSDAASRAKRAGFDAVVIHGAHGYLIAEFLSPLTNKRTDEYGGDIEGRTKFAVEIIKSIRSKVGDFPIIFRFSADEYLKGGLTLEDSKIIAQIIEKAGADAIYLGAGTYGSSDAIFPPSWAPKGLYVHLSEGIKQVVSIPVIAVGKLHDLKLAESVIREGKADLISIGRGLIADPYLPKKVLEGKFDEIRHCIYCNHCADYIWKDGLLFGITCALNADVGREKEYEIIPTKEPKNIIVVGGGPAGMEAARVAALRGHKVTLYEEDYELGGQLLLAAKPPGKDEIKNVISYLSHQIRKLGVRVELGRKVTYSLIEKAKPDAVILATGALPLVPSIPGIERENVNISWDILSGKVKTSKERVIVAGGGMVGCETAMFLAERDNEVTIIEALSDIALDEGPIRRLCLLKKLKQYENINIMTNFAVKEITDQGVVVSRNKKTLILKADRVVLALGAKPNRTLMEELRGKINNIYAIGDCLKPRRLMEAIHEGSDIARKL